MIDDKKIEKAAQLHRFELIASMHGSTLGTPMQCFKEEIDTETELIENSFIKGAHWAINEFLKDLWHPASEEPREKAMLLIEVSFPKPTLKKFYYTDVLIKEDWEITCGTMYISRWLYIDDLISKKGSE